MVGRVVGQQVAKTTIKTLFRLVMSLSNINYRSRQVKGFMKILTEVNFRTITPIWCPPCGPLPQLWFYRFSKNPLEKQTSKYGKDIVHGYS